jgi:DNA topoisomerase-3
MKLVIAEKPSVGLSIAKVVGATKKQDGYVEGNGHVVTWCVGHLVDLADASAYDEKYKKWNLLDLPILPSDWKYVVSVGKGKQLKLIGDLAKRKDVDEVVCATDAGREGELIFRLVYDHIKCKKPVKRLWISSMEDTAVKEGFASLKDGADFDGLYRSALCRARADWLVGINATRLFSCLYGGDTLNVGRVVSPTLAMIVEREKAVRDFVKTPFYNVLLDCGSFAASSEKMRERSDAERMAALCDGKAAVVRDVQSKEKSAAPPKLYDLTTLQRDANRIYGYTAQQTLDTAQALYEKKILTYPRTDSNYITEDMETSVASLANRAALLLPYIKVPVSVNAAQITNGKKVSDHHAILPTETALKADAAALAPAERDMLTLVVVRLLEAVGEKHAYRDTTAVIDCEGAEFKAKGRVILHDGWKAIEKSFKASRSREKDERDEDEAGDEKELPPLNKGDVFDPVSASVKEGFTSPPKHFTEDTLLAAMETAGAEDMPEDAERRGLGTPATRAGILEKLIKSGFVVRQKKNLISTEKAENLISVLPENLKSPKLTAEWEHRLKEIERGTVSAGAFMASMGEVVRRLTEENKTPLPAFVGKFGSGSGGTEKEQTGKCPRCGKNVRDIGKGYACENRGCGFVIWKDDKFFADKKKTVTKEIASALLKDGRVFVKGLYSEKKQKTYDATVALYDTGKYVNFRLEF